MDNCKMTQSRMLFKHCFLKIMWLFGLECVVPPLVITFELAWQSWIASLIDRLETRSRSIWHGKLRCAVPEEFSCGFPACVFSLQLKMCRPVADKAPRCTWEKTSGTHGIVFWVTVTNVPMTCIIYVFIFRTVVCVQHWTDSKSILWSAWKQR